MVPHFWPDCTSETDECCLSVGRTRWTGACETVVLLLRYYSHFQEVIFAPTLSPKVRWESFGEACIELKRVCSIEPSESLGPGTLSCGADDCRVT